MNQSTRVFVEGSTGSAENNRDPSVRPVLRWFLLFTKPGGEDKARVNLERQGLSVYYPRLLLPCVRNGRWANRIVPLFPRYLFVQHDSARPLAPIRSTRGVVKIVGFGGEPTEVPDRLVRDLMAAANPETGLHALKTHRQLHSGAQVSVIAGPFEGLEGLFERELGQERVIVLLKLLGQETRLCIPSGYILPVGV
jgi:transcriptional antiterminator RfaH